MGAKHNSYTYKRMRAALQASAHPGSRCWRCGKTLAEHPKHRNGRPASWHAGHRPDGRLSLEGSTCNLTDGARKGWQAAYGNRRRSEPVSPNGIDQGSMSEPKSPDA